MTQSDETPDLAIDMPCPKTWAELDGDNSKRYCSKCDKHVHNGESMTRSEAVEFVREGQGEVCMRLVADDAGKILYKDTPKKSKSIVRRAGLAIAAGGLVAACTSQPEKASGPDPTPRVDTAQPGQADPIVSDGEAPLELLGEVCVEPEEADTPELPTLESPDHAKMIGQVKITEVPKDPEPRQMLGRIRMVQPTDPAEKNAAACESEKSSREPPKEILGTPGPPPPKREIMGTPGPPPPPK